MLITFAVHSVYTHNLNHILIIPNTCDTISYNMDNNKRNYNSWCYDDKVVPPKKKLKPTLEPPMSELCAICYERIPKMKIVQLNSCTHRYCKNCIQEWSKKQATCPQCRKAFSQFTFYDDNFKQVTVFAKKYNKKTTFYNMKHVYELSSMIKEHSRHCNPYLDLLASIQSRFEENPFNLLDVALRTQLVYWDMHLALITPTILDKSISPFMLLADQIYTSDSRINVMVYWGFSKIFRNRVLNILADEGDHYYHQQRVKATKIYNIIARFYKYNHIPFNLFPRPGGLHEWFMMATNIVENNSLPNVSIENVDVYRTKVTHITRIRGMLLGMTEDDILKEQSRCCKKTNESHREYIKRLPRI